MSWNKTAERGSVLGMRFVMLCLRMFGIPVARFVSEFPICYYFLLSAKARRASRTYLRRVAAFPEGLRALGKQPDAWMVLQHFRSFGHSLVDRAAFWSGLGGRLHVDFPMRPRLLALREQKRGALLLGAHLGSIDVLRALATSTSAPVNFLMFRHQAQKFNAVLRSIDNSQEMMRAIAIDPGSISFVIELQAAIARGELVAILGDRADLASEKRTARATFLGAQASFPLGPLWIAHLLECPVFLLFALKRGPDSYEICLEPFAERILLDRKRRDLDLQAWLERYVRRLEAHCLAMPLQWFNFYDFWPAEKASARAAAGGAVPGSGPTVMQENSSGRT